MKSRLVHHLPRPPGTAGAADFVPANDADMEADETASIVPADDVAAAADETAEIFAADEVAAANVVAVQRDTAAPVPVNIVVQAAP
mmetsp:Transcript_32469/g.49006  ORF Transcript_32469/g.49006 Transcript_32469/m.49006 type:complete len:86 (-) Transcript_32469:557-814(-)